MARWTKAVSVTFNENDGKVGWTANPEAMSDLLRHWSVFGVWRTRWILLKRFWIALKWLEHYSDNTGLLRKDKRKWIFKARIPE